MIVGIGASAGGLQAIVGALETFTSPPAETCFVVIQHLAPDKKSYMLDILTTKLALPVRVIEQETIIEPGTVYIAPPGKIVSLISHKLIPSDAPAPHGPQKNIDFFFKSLALNNLNHCVGVVLSGTGTDGLRGCQDLYEAGADVFVQDLLEAEFPGMPEAVLQSGFYTKTIKVADLIDALDGVANGRDDLLSHREAFLHIQDKLAFISDFLKQDFGVDLSHYKPGTLLRRISKRMEFLHKNNIEAYLETLRLDSTERRLLFEEIMIAVTSFFRDPEFYQALEEQVLLSRLGDGAQVRAWVAGCSKGQEAYSLAILLSELKEKHQLTYSIKIFATDINPANIDYASRGVYQRAEIESLPEAYVAKYFRRQDDCYVVSTALRDGLIFSRHDVITSPPFSNVDIVSCRNLLIYLSQKSQKRALTNLLFSLRIGGVLALGPSETLGDIASSVGVLDGKWRLYKKLKKFNDLPFPKWEQPYTHAKPDQLERISKLSSRHQHRNFSLELLEALYPHALVISEDFELLASFGQAHRLLNKEPRGIMSLAIDQLFSPGLGVSISALLLEARNKKARLLFQGLALDPPSSPPFNQLSITFVEGVQGLNLYLCELSHTAQAPRPELVKDAQKSSDLIASLQLELQDYRHQLTATLSAMDESQEELQTTNEELIASNEELQSTNEELNSVNEELYTLNSELQEKMNQLSITNGDLENLINALNIGVIYLDHNLIIRRVTNHPAAVLNVRSSDAGRSLFDLKAGEVLRPLHAKIKSGESLDESLEYVVDNKSFYLIRLTSFQDKKLGELGYIITLVDITDSKKNEIFLEETHKVTRTGGWIVDLTTMKPTWSRQVYAIHELDYGVPVDLAQAINFFAPHERKRIADCVALCQRGTPYEETFEFVTAKGRHIWVRATGRPVYGVDGKVSMLTGTFQDITDMRLSDQRYSLALEVTQTGVWTWNYLEGTLAWDKQMYQLYGLKLGTELTYQDWRAMIHPGDLVQLEQQLLSAIDKRQLYQGQFRIKHPSGETRWLSCSARGLYNLEDKLYQIIGVNSDKTAEILLQEKFEEEKRLNQQAMKMASLGELAAGIGHEVNNPLAIMVSLLETLKEHPSVDPKALETIDKILDAGLRIRDIVDGLRSITRDHTKEQARLHDANTLTESIYRLLHEIYKKEGIELTFSPLETSAPIRVRFGALQQVLMNLVSNAHDALTDAKQKSISISLRRDSEQVLIDVTDTGSGIREADLEKIFQSFYTTKEIGKGTGLGLSISQKIVMDEGGTLSVRSILNLGTTFTIALPRQTEAPLAPAPTVPTDQALPESLRGQRALVVDDEEDLREIIELILTKEGAHVQTAKNGGDALALWKAGQFDLVVTDLSMPTMSGAELIYHMRDRLSPATRVYVISGGVKNDWQVVEGVDITALITDTIPKPFTKKSLIDKLCRRKTP